MGSGPSAEGGLFKVQTNGEMIWITNKCPDPTSIYVICYRYKGGKVTEKIRDDWVHPHQLWAQPEARLDVIEDFANKDGKIQYKLMAWPIDRQAKDGYAPEIVTLEYKRGHKYWGYPAPYMFLEQHHGEREWIDPSTELTPDALKPAAPTEVVTDASPSSARLKRWGDGIEAPAAGARSFIPDGFEMNVGVEEAIQKFGHSNDEIEYIMMNGKAKTAAAPLHIRMDSELAAALFAYTLEAPQLYGKLNFTMRTPHTPTNPTDDTLKHYQYYIRHLENAISSLPSHVSDQDGVVYRGVASLLPHHVYARDKIITWQSFSSTTKNQMKTLNFVEKMPGRKLQGSIFVIHSTSGKAVQLFSDYAEEEEVLFRPNSQFKVVDIIVSEEGKQRFLDQLGAYSMEDLDVYELKQVA